MLQGKNSKKRIKRPWCDQVGAQNAGKSSLINAMRRAVGRTSPRHDVTAAALPGTTLGTFLKL